jgi:hypothetical protein
VPAITYVSLAVAFFSLATAMYQGYVQTRNLEAVQRDITRRELIRGCKDVIESYFEVKLRIRLLRDAALRGDATETRVEAAKVAGSRFAAVGTFLANGQGEEARSRYTELSRELGRLGDAAASGDLGTDDAIFTVADGLFRGMNDDCVNSARADPA